MDAAYLQYGPGIEIVAFMQALGYTDFTAARPDEQKTDQFRRALKLTRPAFAATRTPKQQVPACVSPCLPRQYRNPTRPKRNTASLPPNRAEAGNRSCSIVLDCVVLSNHQTDCNQNAERLWYQKITSVLTCLLTGCRRWRMQYTRSCTNGWTTLCTGVRS